MCPSSHPSDQCRHTSQLSPRIFSPTRAPCVHRTGPVDIRSVAYASGRVSGVHPDDEVDPNQEVDHHNERLRSKWKATSIREKSDFFIIEP